MAVFYPRRVGSLRACAAALAAALAAAVTATTGAALAAAALCQFSYRVDVHEPLPQNAPWCALVFTMPGKVSP